MFDLLRCKLFPIGNITFSQAIADEVKNDNYALFNQLMVSVFKHAGGNWGTVSAEIREANEQAIRSGGPIRSCYSEAGSHILILTTSDRLVTRILRPEELKLQAKSLLTPLAI